MAETKKQYYYGLGRRKEATARARLYTGGKGIITINDKPAADYLAHNESMMWDLIAPLRVLEIEKSHDVSLRVSGGGPIGQVDACKRAMAKAATVLNPDWRGTLKKAGLMKRDPRVKERKKYGLKGARKKEQFSKR